VKNETYQVQPNTLLVFTDMNLLANYLSRDGGPLKVVGYEALGTITGMLHQFTDNPIGQYAYIPKAFTANKVERMKYTVED
jgi:hypothetical protein